jgi:hypothetical protein
MSVAQAYVNSFDLFGGVPMSPGVLETSGTDALLSIPRANFNAATQLAASSLGANAELRNQERLLDYYTERDKTARKGNLLAALFPASGIPLAGSGIARAAQKGLSLPSVSSTAKELSDWMAFTDQYGQRARQLSNQATQGSWAGLREGMAAMKSI